ncbi:MAG: ESPR domain-containing protein, partial [Pseudomonas sp.]
MNRIYRLVFNHATGQMQVASELTSTHSSAAAATGSVRRRSQLSAAMLLALGLSAASLPSAFAAVYDFDASETVTDTRGYVDGFRVGPNGKVLVDVRNGGTLTSNGLVSFGTSVGSNSELRVYGPTS